MSQKISGKNLHYDTTLPPFLARLRGEAAAVRGGDGPDPLLARNRRHAAPRSGSAEAEDAPLVVDEEGNVVAGLKVGADGAVTEKEEEETAAERIAGEEGSEKDGADKEKDDVKEKEKIAGIGGGKKRKAGKVVGAEDGDEKVGDKAGSKEGRDGDVKAAPPAKKKKAKKIKLSFGDDDG